MFNFTHFTFGKRTRETFKWFASLNWTTLKASCHLKYWTTLKSTFVVQKIHQKRIVSLPIQLARLKMLRKRFMIELDALLRKYSTEVCLMYSYMSLYTCTIDMSHHQCLLFIYFYHFTIQILIMMLSIFEPKKISTEWLEITTSRCCMLCLTTIILAATSTCRFVIASDQIKRFKINAITKQLFVLKLD